MRTQALVLLASLAVTTLASAQDVAAPPTPPATAAPTVPPVMVAVLTTGSVPDDVIAAVQSALVDGVRPMSGARPVLPLAMAEMRDRLGACADAACRGAMLAEAGAIGAILARLSRRSARGGVALVLDIVDPVSGASRLPEPLSGSVVDAAAVAAALAPLIEQLRPVMFSPPPPPATLLVTVNVDGASVMIDEASAGESPVAAMRVTPGQHVVLVSRAGYSGTRRTVEVADGEQARIDVVLAPLEGSAAVAAGPGPSYAGPAASTPWYEEWYVWVGVGAGVLVIAGVIIGAVIASQPTAAPDPMGIPLPGIRF